MIPTQTCPHCQTVFSVMPSSLTGSPFTGYRNHVRVCEGRSPKDRAYFREHRHWPWPRRVRKPPPSKPSPTSRVKLPVYRGPDF